jgi:hypothetical protein
MCQLIYGPLGKPFYHLPTPASQKKRFPAGAGNLLQ